MTSSAADFLMGASSPSAKFPQVGATLRGRITRIGDPIQQRNITDGKPKTWDDGSPMLQLPVDVLTDERDPEITNDDGTRTLYIKSNMKKAITDAVKAAGAKMLEVGGTLTVTYAADGEVKQRGFNPPKVYIATYAPPAKAAAAAFLGTDSEIQQQAAAPSTAPAAQVSLPGGVSVTPEVAELLAKLQGQQAAAS